MGSGGDDRGKTGATDEPWSLARNSDSVIKCEFGSAVNLIFMAAHLTAAAAEGEEKGDEEEVMPAMAEEETVKD